MGIRCSVLGCDYDGTEIEREEERRGSEVVLTVREYEQCVRCGNVRVISENTGVTAVEWAAARDDDRQPPEAVTGDGPPPEDGPDAEIIREAEGEVSTVAGPDTPDDEPDDSTTPGDETDAPDTPDEDDAVILDAGDDPGGATTDDVTDPSEPGEAAGGAAAPEAVADDATDPEDADSETTDPEDADNETTDPGETDDGTDPEETTDDETDPAEVAEDPEPPETDEGAEILDPSVGAGADDPSGPADDPGGPAGDGVIGGTEVDEGPSLAEAIREAEGDLTDATDQPDDDGVILGDGGDDDPTDPDDTDLVDREWPEFDEDERADRAEWLDGAVDVPAEPGTGDPLTGADVGGGGDVRADGDAPGSDPGLGPAETGAGEGSGVATAGSTAGLGDRTASPGTGDPRTTEDWTTTEGDGVAGELHCPECASTWSLDRTAHLPGDICPSCTRGYLDER